MSNYRILTRKSNLKAFFKALSHGQPVSPQSTDEIDLLNKLEQYSWPISVSNEGEYTLETDVDTTLRVPMSVQNLLGHADGKE